MHVLLPVLALVASVLSTLCNNQGSGGLVNAFFVDVGWLKLSVPNDGRYNDKFRGSTGPWSLLTSPAVKVFSNRLRGVVAPTCLAYRNERYELKIGILP